MKKKILLIDASGLLFRSYFAMIRNPLRTKDGQPTSAVFGFLRMIFSVIKKKPCHMIITAFDVPRASLERTKQFSEYKSTRKETPPDLISQISIARECLELANICVLSKEGYEADDVLASLVNYYKNEAEIVVFSGDKDLLQLVSDNVTIAWPDKNYPDGIRILDRQAVKQYKGIYPEEIPDYLAILGDTSDNIPGIKGIGEKGAIELINEFHTLSNIYDNLEKIKSSIAKKLEENKDNGFLSLELVHLRDDLILNFPVLNQDFLTLNHLITSEFISKLQDLELFSLLNELSNIKQNDPHTNFLFPIDAEIIIQPFTLNSFDILQKSEELGLKLLDDILYFGSSEVVFSLKKEHIPQYQGLIQIFFSRCQANNKKIIVFDLKKLIHFFDDFDISIPDCDDLKIMFYLIDPSRNNYSLEYLCLSYLGRNDTTPKSFSDLRKILKKIIKENAMEDLYSNIEMPLRPILAKLEKTGICIDVEILKKISHKLEKRLLVLEETIYHLAGKKFNILSPKQLSQILFEDLGLKPYKKTKGKSYSTAEETLEFLSLVHPLPKEILEYRSLAKFKNTYTDAFPKLVDENSRLHTTFHQTVAATGRLSSGEPNLQNIPIRTELGKEIRSAFIAPKGKILVSADYSQIELRLCACLSNDKKMKDFFLSGGDIHINTAAEMFHISKDQVTKNQRRAAKTVNYGLTYGMSAYRLSNELGVEFGEAKQFIDMYFDMFPGIQKFMMQTLEFAKMNGFVKTLFGRRRPTPELFNKSVDKLTNLSHPSRFAINAVIQGTAADIIKIAMLKVQELIDKKYSTKVFMILQIHDELLFEVDSSIEEQFNDDLVRVMSSIVTLDLSLDVEIGSGNDWNHSH